MDWDIYGNAENKAAIKGTAFKRIRKPIKLFLKYIF